MVKVDIPNGTCECSYSMQKHIPCKHMFAVFHVYPSKWDWNKLPLSLTSASHLVLETDIYLETTECSNSQVICSDQSASESPNPPSKCTPAHKLKLAQIQARDCDGLVILIIKTKQKPLGQTSFVQGVCFMGLPKSTHL